MLNIILLVLLGLFVFNFINIDFTENFKGQIGTYNVCPDCSNTVCNESSVRSCGIDPTLKNRGEYVKRKYPHYYGMGTWGYHYGEPYYCAKTQPPPNPCK